MLTSTQLALTAACFVMLFALLLTALQQPPADRKDTRNDD